MERHANEGDLMDDETLLEQIDACRPGSSDHLHDDLLGLARRLDEDPRARELYSRVQRLDALVSDAIHDVPVPAGLSGRLLAALAASAATAPLAEDHGALQPAGAPAAPGGSRPRRFGRRTWIGLATAAAVLVSAGIVSFFRGSGELDWNDVQEQAVALHREGADAGVKWKRGNLPASYVPDGLSPPGEWRSVEFLGRRGVAFELKAGRARATLLAVKAASPAVNALSPPAAPQYADGYHAFAVWRRNDILFVLVLDRRKDYSQFLPPVRVA